MAGKLVLVAGATGQQGGAVARELLKAGYQVRAMTRTQLLRSVPGKLIFS